MVEMAFRKWITMVTTVRFPLVVFSGILVQFPLFKGTFIVPVIHVIRNP